MKKILIISYYLPPANFVGGERVDSWAKHLHKFGYYPIVVTRNWNEGQTDTFSAIIDNKPKQTKDDKHEINRISYNLNWRDRLFNFKNSKIASIIRRGLTLFEQVTGLYTIKTIPHRNLYDASKRILLENPDIKGVIISGSPFESFHYGYLLNKTMGVKWIADYRDEWNSHQGHRPKSIIHRSLFALEANVEKKWLASASCFTTVSPYLVDHIGEFIKTKGHSIMNGFEPSLYERNNTTPSKNESTFVLTYNGTIYYDQDLSIFKTALDIIVAKFNQLKFQMNFIGLGSDANMSVHISKQFSGFKGVLNITPRMPKEEMINILYDSDLLFLTRYSNAKGWYPVKMFDYYAVGKPVLLCPSDHADIEKFVRKTNSGFVANTVEECVDILEKMVQAKLTNEPIEFKRNTQEGDFYTRENQARILADVLDQHFG